MIDNNTICSAAVIQMHEDDLYKDVNWKRHNPAITHLLATHPIKQHKGYAKQLLSYLIEVARNNNKDSIHLDIVKNNDYAKNLYEGIGFLLIEDRELYYPDTGTILSTLFELLI